MLKLIYQLPFKSSVLTANVTFAIFFTLIILASGFGGTFGLFILPAAIIFSAAYMQYCFDLGMQAAMGATEPDVYKFRALNFQALAFTFLIIMLYQSINTWFGETIARFIIALIMPAILSSMLIEQEWSHALNPLNWLKTMLQLKQHYFIISVVLYLAFMLSYLMQSSWFLLLNMFVVLSITSWVFFTVGVILYQQREKLRMQTPIDASEFKAHTERAKVEETFEHRSDSWHRMARVREITKALTAIDEYLLHQNKSIEAYEQVMTELCSWQNKRLAVVFLDKYLPVMVQSRKAGLAYAKVRLLWNSEGPLEIKGPASRQAIIEFAQDSNDLEISDYLIEASGSQSTK